MLIYKPRPEGPALADRLFTSGTIITVILDELDEIHPPAAAQLFMTPAEIADYRARVYRHNERCNQIEAQWIAVINDQPAS